MKDLPKVYAGKVREDINNYQDIFYGNDRVSENKENNNVSISKKINAIFASSSHVYKSNVNITLKDNKRVQKTIVGKTNTHLITKEGELIKIIDIKDIVKI